MTGKLAKTGSGITNLKSILNSKEWRVYVLREVFLLQGNISSKPIEVNCVPNLCANKNGKWKSKCQTRLRKTLMHGKTVEQLM